MPASVCRNHVVQTLPDFLVTSTRDNTSFYNEAAIRIIDGEDGGIANKISQWILANTQASLNVRLMN